MKNFLTNKTAQMWLWLIFLLLAWELASRLGWVHTHILPPFSRVAANTFNELFAGRLGVQVLNSMSIILVGFFLSFTLATVITALSMWLQPIDSLFNTLSTIMNPVPTIALMPLIIMWFGIDTGAMLVLMAHSILWALIRNLLDGLRSVPPMYREWGKNIGLSPWQMFTDIVVPAIMPHFLAGVRIGWGRAWRSLISAEMIFGMIGGFGGLGFFIYTARAFANFTRVMSGVVVIIIIGILFETLLFGQIEKHTIRKWGMATHE